MRLARVVLASFVLALSASSCGSSSPDSVTLVVPQAQAALFEAFADAMQARARRRLAVPARAA